MGRPSELSAQLLDAYNRRDRAAMREMLSPEILYIRPGPARVDGVDSIMSLYESDWERYDNQNVIRRMVEDGDTVAMEFTVGIAGADPIEVEAVVLHRWVDDRLVFYRLYVDPLPDQ